jgi:adenosine deaminase
MFGTPALLSPTQKAVIPMLRKTGNMLLAWTATVALVTLMGVPGLAQTTHPGISAASHGRSDAGNAEGRTARAFAVAAQQGPLALHAFLVGMPKGADLHMHLSGAVYAETLVDEAAHDGLCVDTQKLALDGADGPGGPAGGDSTSRACKPGEVSGVAALEQDNHLRDELIDSFSMRGFVPSAGVTGHDQFFATFGRFQALGDRHMGEWLDQVATRAAAQNEQYLEIMHTPDLKPMEALAAHVAAHAGYDGDFVTFRAALLQAGLNGKLGAAEDEIHAAEATRDRLEHCATPQALPACTVKVRFLFQVLREQSPVDVLAQVLFAFELAKHDPEVLGLNFVQPEDGYISMRDYRLQMSMLDALHGFYPGVHISLHAGELAPGLVPPEGLTFHIRSAIEQGHAERIGHGVDVLYEDRPHELLHEMAERHIAVEINLTSNAVILGVSGNEQPLPEYLRAGVPVALSTDDEGVSRIDLTHEYVRAADTYHLSYGQLKQMARASLEHSFLPGASLWQNTTPETLGVAVPSCRGQLGNDAPAGLCALLVHSSEKATQQWELEHRFHTFERSF